MKFLLVVFITFLHSFSPIVLGNSEFDRSEKLSNSKLKLSNEGLVAALKRAKAGKPASLLEESNSTISSSELGITLPPEYANDTIIKDHHTYYNSTFYSDPEKGKELWIDLDKIPGEKIITHEMLSDSHRQASTIDLSFEFPFYGSPLKSLTVATGGFLYMGDYLHNWIAATQYVAPLMANFDTTLSRDSTIKYYDNGTAFTVQWDHVHIQDRPNDGAFTFQATLFKNGDICFAYKEVPFSISDIADDRHPVKVGISDAYILERAVFYVRRKTIYEYHRIDMLKREIRNNSAIYFTALPTCLSNKDCDSCMAADKEFECTWCEPVQRCSDGIDRQRQSWVVNGCTIQHAKTCPATASTPNAAVTSAPVPVPKKSDSSTDSSKKYSTTMQSTSNSLPVTSESIHAESEGSEIPVEYHSENEIRKEDLERADRFTQTDARDQSNTSMSTGVIVAIIVFITILLAVGLWMFYAYRYPQSSSGQFLIKYRPSQWNVRSDGNNDSFKM